mgnify:CR=1 FL=1
MKKLLINILCGFIPGRQRRKRIRTRLNNPIIKQMAKFAKKFSANKKPKIKYTYGYRCANFVVNVDDIWVLKFPLRDNGKEKSIREQRITDSLRAVSSIKIPDMEIIEWNGMYVRKYECVRGVGFHGLSESDKNKYAPKIAKQLAQCFYEIGMTDPKEIRDLKPNPKDKPAKAYGWNNNDLWDNFILDEKTYDVIAMIDWEDAVFGNFEKQMTSGTGNTAIKEALVREYSKFFNE